MRPILVLLCVMLLSACGDAVRSAHGWDEVRDRVVPDQRSGELCDLFGCIPCFDGSDRLTWMLADGSFSGVFYPDPPGDPRLLHGGFRPGTPATERPLPSPAEMAAVQRLQAHWRSPDPAIAGTLETLRTMAARQAGDERAHQERLCDAFASALAWAQAGDAGAPPLPARIEKPGDLDVVWACFYATGDDRCLRLLLRTGAATDLRPGLVFPARWSVQANMRQDHRIRERVAGLDLLDGEDRLRDILVGSTAAAP